MNLPRALIGPIWAMAGRPARPAIEAMLVREAVAGQQSSTEGKARALAKAVVRELAAYLDEEGDELSQAMGEFKRAAFASPAVKLATDAEIDTLALYVEGRTGRLRARAGRGICSQADAMERDAVLTDIERRLTGRYLRHLRR
jgi:hypothetical protein